MIVTTEPCIKRRFWDSWDSSSDTARHYYNVLLAIVVFFIAQFLTCAWDQPFWIAGLDFPGQIAAMVFVWIVMWASQVLFYRPGEGLEWFYHRYLRAPVSRSFPSSTDSQDTNDYALIQTEVLNKHMSIGFTVPFLNLIRDSFAGADQVGILTAAFRTLLVLA